MANSELVRYLQQVINIISSDSFAFEHAQNHLNAYARGSIDYETARSRIAAVAPGIFVNAASGSNSENVQVEAPAVLANSASLTAIDKLRFVQKLLESNTANEKAIVDAKIVALESRNHQLETELAELKAMFHNFIIVDNAKTQALATAINSLHDNQQHITTAGEKGELLNDQHH